MSDFDEMKDLLEKVRERKQQPEHTAPEVVDVEASDLVKEYGLSTDDTRVKAALARDYTDPRDKRIALAELAVKMHFSQPSDADRSSEPKEPRRMSRDAALMDEYKRGSANLRGNAFIEFKQKMRRKGLDIT